MKKVLIICIAVVMLGTTIKAQCTSKKTVHYTSYSDSRHQDIVDVAASSDDFSTLVTAVKAAGLVDVLKSEGPFTVFAPNNIAFAKLPEGTVGSLVQKENKKTLVSILTYHVIPGKITAESLVNTIKATGGEVRYKTVQGAPIIAKIINGNPVLIDTQGHKSFITKTDLSASNGVIHVIDEVVMPE